MASGSKFDQSKWDALAAKELKGRIPTAIRSASGLRLKPVYCEADCAGLPHVGGTPGEYPFVRGPRASMFLGRPWTIRQYAGFSTAAESNAFYKQALAEGQSGLSVAFDLPTHRGYDSDHARVRGDVGKAGVAIDSVEDMAVLFEGIDLSQVSVSMTMNGAVLPVLAAYVVVAEEQGVSRAALTGTIQNDILKEFLVRNTYVYPPQESMRIVADVIGFCSEELPRFNPVSISGYHFQEAGATTELELALTIADGLEYVQTAVDHGLSVDDFAPRLSFFFGVGMNLFAEVSKLRAARLLWAELMSERFSPQKQESLRLRTHCQTSGVSLTAQEPLNNVTRTAIEALAAVLGGTQSLHTNSFDEAIALPSDHAARIARDTQLILRHETDAARVVDPLAGSYLVESLTDQLATKARALVEELYQLGGMTRAIALGVPQAWIASAATHKQVRLDRGEDLLVGMNCFERTESGSPPIARVIDDRIVLQSQLARLDRLRRSRDSAAVDQTLSELERVARSADAGLLCAAVACMRARATVGEVSERLAQVFGRHQPKPQGVLGIYSTEYADMAEWKSMLGRVESFERRVGRRPRVLVAKLGQDGHDRGAKVIASGFADLGFDVDLGALFQTPEEVARAAVDSDVHVVGISTQAAAHVSLVPELCAELERLGAGDILVVCGGIIPKHDQDALKEAGVSLIFEPGAKVLDCAGEILTLLGSA